MFLVSNSFLAVWTWQRRRWAGGEESKDADRVRESWRSAAATSGSSSTGTSEAQEGTQ